MFLLFVLSALPLIMSCLCTAMYVVDYSCVHVFCSFVDVNVDFRVFGMLHVCVAGFNCTAP